MIINIFLGYVLPFILLVGAGFLVKNFREDKVVEWVGIAVKAAEQIYKESGMGKEKFEYVKNWISEKYNISDVDLKNIIESAVYELNNTKKKEDDKAQEV